MWTIEAYCEAQQPSDWSVLPESSQQFLQTLNLSSLHPFCHDGAPPFAMEGVPPMGQLPNRFDGQTTLETMYTLWRMIAPPLMAMSELWLRLFGAAIAPLGIVYLVFCEIQDYRRSSSIITTTSQKEAKQKPTLANVAIRKKYQRNLSLVCLLTVSSSLVVMTDTLYVLARGELYGAIVFLVSTVLALNASYRHNLTGVSTALGVMMVVSAILMWNPDSGEFEFGNAADAVQISEGLYYDSSNPFVSTIVQNWPEHFRTYDSSTGATIWMPTGDSRTGLPFLL
jgi:hypothetical protein